MAVYQLFCVLLATVTCLSNSIVNERCLRCHLKKQDNGFFNCSRCELQEIPDFPSTATKIELSDNHIQSIGNMSFSKLFNLQILNMSRNQISVIEHSAFGCNVDMEELNLSFNFLNTLSDSVFQNLSRLRRLFIDHNLFNEYPTGVRYLIELTELKVDVFRNFHFGNDFLFLCKLTNISLNPVGNFKLRNDSFYGLQNSPIENLRLDFWMSVQYPLENNFLIHFHHLKSLSIAFGMSCSIVNVLESLYGLRGRSLDDLIFDHNMLNFPFPQDGIVTEHNIRHLITICVHRLIFVRDELLYFPFGKVMNSTLSKCLRHVYFFRNQLFIALTDLLGLLSLPFLETIDLPLSINPSLGYFSPGLIEYDDLETKRTFHMNITLTISPSVKHLDFSYNLLAVFGDFKPERNYSGFNLKLRWIFNFSNIKTIRLANTQTQFCNYDFDIRCPHLILLNASGWLCNYLNPSIWNKCGQLKYFNISNSQLGLGFKNDMDCRFLGNKFHLEELDLSHNGLDRLCDSLFHDSSFSLKILYLDLNLFRHLPSSLRVLKRIRYISFRHNILEYFNEQDLLIMEGANETSFDFYGNKFDCSCKAKDGIIWMSEHAGKLTSIKTLKCIDGRDLSDIIQNIHYFRLRCLSIFWLQFSIISILFLMITILLTLVCVKHKALLLYFYLRAKHFLRGRKTLNINEYKFDIFISYSQEDCDWVVNFLCRKLSNEFKLRVCFHENDFKPGMRISDNIYNCIVDSRLHLFVITQAFLQSTWGMYEMELTRECVLRSREDENIIVIFKEDIPVSDMPKALKEVWFRVTCLKWPVDASDVEQVKIFWARLADVTILR